MKPVFWIPAACALIVTLSSCGTNSPSSGTPSGVGPFDHRGNYREEWADDPSKWGKGGGASSSSRDAKPDALPLIAQNDQPPPDSNPLPPAGPSKSSPAISHTEVTSKSKKTSEKSESVSVKSKSTSKKSSTEVAKSKAKAKPVAVKVTPKPTAVKVKPKTYRYTVKTGESLTSIAKRLGVSTSAIQRASGTSSSKVKPGQTLTIPNN